MKHEEYFEDFLRENIELNRGRIETLNQRVRSVMSLLKSKLSGYCGVRPQGSYAQGTIIKPVGINDEFDADILVFIEDERFNPYQFNEDYIRRVYDVFRDDGRYKDIVRLKKRCVTLDYAGDFHLDIVPCVYYQSGFYICNRVEQKYEQTDGGLYVEWFVDKNEIIGRNCLRKVACFLKFLRDHKNTFSVESILLITLLGNLVCDSDRGSREFSDLPTSLKTLSNRLNDFLQLNPTMPCITNPVLPSEDLTRNWDERKYANFRGKFDAYNRKINDAFEEKNHDKSVKKWRELFGDNFGELHSVRNPGSSNGFLPVVPSVKPYSSHKNISALGISYSSAEMEKVRSCFPGLYYADGVIRGEMSFSARYQLSGGKKKIRWTIVSCSSGKDCVEDVYEIEIHLEGQPRVFEVGGRIKGLAKKLGCTVADLHLIPSDGSCCLGLFLANEKETLSGFVVNKVYPYFVWQSYFERFGRTPPCGEYSHGEQGVREFWEDVFNAGRNSRCPCGSGKKFKRCCEQYRRDIRFRP